MAKFFNTVNRNLIFIISASMFLGFVYGLIFPAAFLKSFVAPCVFLIVYPMMASLKVEDVFKGNDFKLQLSSQIINFFIIPFLSFGIGLMFFKNNPYAVLGMLLIGLLPTGVSTISWTGFSKGNIGSATKMAVTGPIFGVILTPFYVNFLIGSSIEIDLLLAVKQIVFVIILPMLLGILTRRLLLIRYKEEELKKTPVSFFPSFSMIGIIGVVFIAMALKSKNIVQDPLMFLYILLPVVSFYLICFNMSTLVGKLFFNRGSTIALVYGTSMRNLSLSLAIAMNMFDGGGSDAALVITVAYIVQVQSAMWYAKLSDKIFMREKHTRGVLLAAKGTKF